MNYVKHENSYSRKRGAVKRAYETLNTALDRLRHALDAENPEIFAQYCEWAIDDIDLSLHYRGYTTKEEKRADEVLEAARKERERKRHGNA